MSETKIKEDVEEPTVIRALEEDDEFEDFPEDSEWKSQSKVNSADLWEEDWDDEDNEDEFTQKLREELARAKK
jgi:26 proteasome complex subunit DSS1